MDVSHETASVYLLARFGSLWRLGVIEHPRHGGWMVPGGHLQRGERPPQAAVRETVEETGYRPRLLRPAGHSMPPDYPHAPARPANATVGGTAWWVVGIPAGPDGQHPQRHLHIDHIHVAVADRPYGPTTPRAHPFRWVTARELEPLDAPVDTRILGRALLDTVPATVTARRPSPARDDELRRELLRRRDADQAFRNNLPRTIDEETAARWAEIDEGNTAWLRQVIDQVGWPGRALCGENGADAAWLLAQHADRQPQLQEAWVELLAEAVTAGDAEPRHLAYLEDRIAVHACKGKQWFGTQHRPAPGGGYEPFPIHDPGGVDHRRAEQGLEPLSEATKRINGTNT
ncbi:DUF6624 domain-containing protein [Streptomyces sp. NPDC001404]|uniref:DUF6624 domain-containing protein n=1 Tax=Streptomyces sp. NPDC001404 TaxID=3364571 RepID=UPI0036C68EF2